MTIQTVRNLRRTSQVVFFLIFFWLILKTTFEVDLSPAEVSEIQLPYPVSIALELDPLAALMTTLASGTLYKGLLWSLVILVPTIFIGRFFCGWLCPLGSLNHWMSGFRSERGSRKGKRLLESNRYKKYQRIKYYVLFFCLGAALLGSLQAGLLDPLPLLARSIGTAFLPALHTGALALAALAADTGIGPVAAALLRPARRDVAAVQAGAFPRSGVHRPLVRDDPLVEPCLHPLLVSRHLPAGSAARRLLAVRDIRARQGRGGVQQL
jgi:hypothetical protein